MTSRAPLAFVLLAACSFDPSGPVVGGGAGGDSGVPIDPVGDGGGAPDAGGLDGGVSFDAAIPVDAVLIGSDARACPGVYQPGPTGCYRVATVPRRWVEIEINCETDDGHLVVIGSADEQAYVTTLLGGASAWIGASDRVVRGFVWVTRATATFSAWRRGEPNDGGLFSIRGEDCVETQPDGWNDQACGDERIGVCEHDGIAADPTTY